MLAPIIWPDVIHLTTAEFAMIKREYNYLQKEKQTNKQK